MGKTRPKHYEAAGGVLVRRDQVLVLRRPSRGEVRLPKGHVEAGESSAEAALREVREETGYVDLQLAADLGTQTVAFDLRGDHVVRNEHYFLVEVEADAIGRQPADPAFEPLWLPWPEAEDQLTYEAEREWVRRARRAQTDRAAPSHVRICLSTGSLYTYGVARVFAIASAAGFDGVEVLVDHRWDTRHASYLRRLAETHEQPIVALHSPFVPHVPGWPIDQLGRLQRTVALAHELQVGLVVTHLPQAFVALSADWLGARHWRLSLHLPWPYPAVYARFLHDDLADFEARERITVCVENMPASRLMGLRVNNYRFNRVERLRCFPHLVLDTTHLGTWGLDPLDVYDGLGARVAHVHLSHYDARSARHHQSPVEGGRPLGRLLERLAAAEYTGAITIEGNPATLSADRPDICMAMLRSAVAFCRRYLRRAGADK